MRERAISAIKVVLMLGICVAGITFMHVLEGNANTPPPDISHSKDIVTLKPSFYDKPAKDGLWEALKFYDIKCADIVYAQAILETGHFKSIGCLEHNNLFGLYNSKAGRYYRFNHWVESVTAYKEWIQRRYKPPETYYRFLERINYASDPLYTWKLKQIVRQNEKRRSIGVCPSDSLSLHAPSIPNRVR